MPIMLVAATGGHLAQLTNLAPRIPGFDRDSMWVTFDTPQSRSLLERHEHVFIPYTGSRDLLMAARNVHVARTLLRRTRPSLVVSTGNAVAVSFLPLASAYGIPAAYIESAARAAGPSMTGRILRRTPGIQLYTQYQAWADPPWQYVGSIFDQFVADPIRRPRPVRRVLLTLGTVSFGFRRLVEHLLKILPPACDIVWQVGATDVSGLGITAQRTLPAKSLETQMRACDVVIAHAGIGSALAALEVGKTPILVPRERRHGEHVDDHQQQIARTLDALGLASHRRVDDLQFSDLEDAAARRTVPSTRLPPLRIAT